MKLVVPTDFEILEAMSNAQRQTAPNLAEILDQRRQYMNDRLSHLASLQLVRKVGPSDRSGMYEITSKGLTALEFREYYDHEKASDFANLVNANQPRYENRNEKSQDSLLKKIHEGEPYQPFQKLVDDHSLDTDHLKEMLEELESLGLIKKKKEKEERYYTTTQAGEMVVTSLQEPGYEDSLMDETPMD